MKQLQFDYVLDEQQKQYKENLTRYLLQQKVIQEWLQANNANQRFIYEHCGMFLEYLKVMQRCEQCQGLSVCSQPLKGMRRELMVEEKMLMPIHVGCHFQKHEAQRSAHQNKYLVSDFPKHYLYIDLWNIDITKESKSYTEAMMKAMGVIGQNSTKGLYIWGLPGVGKTYLLAGMCNQLAKQGKSICFVNVPKLVSDLKQMFQDSGAMEQYLYRITNCDVLVLDDIGSESVTAWSRDEILLTILDQRMEQHKLTCFSSNYSMKELQDKYTYANGKYTEKVAASRILERIMVLTCEIFIKGVSRRK